MSKGKEKEPKSRRLKKSSKKLKKVLTNEKPYGIISP